MKNIIICGLSLIASLTSAQAVLSVTSANVTGFQDESGTALTSGVLGVLVVDTAGNGFGAVTAGDIQVGATLGDDDYIDGGDDLIIKLFDSTTALGSSFLQAGGSNSIEFADGASRDFIVYWFPSLSVAGGSTAITAGDRYGAARDAATWTLSSTDGFNTNGAAVTSAGAATLTAVPEPTSTALLGLGGLSLLMRRRRA